MPRDVLVIGGGPAGASAARLLALWGHDVRLVTLPSVARDFHPATLAESLPPSCSKIFDAIGVREAIERAGFLRSTGNTVWWGADDARVETFEHGAQGWQVTRHALAAVLLASAQAAGVRIEHAHVVSSGRALAPPFTAAIILDCTGRGGLFARARGWRVYEQTLRTVALVGAWHKAEQWRLPDPTHTLIESYAGGWAWSVPVDDHRGYFAVMVDPRSSDLSDGASRSIYLSELAKTRRLSALVNDADLEGGPWGWDASMYSSLEYADDSVLLVGDAGSFIDPLSSAGVKKALASAWLAAIAAHTALVRPSMRRTAFDFFAAREREIYTSFRTLTERFLADAAQGHQHPFWADRAGPLDVEDSRRESGADSADSDVQTAFDALRKASALAVRRSEEVRIESRPAVSGCEVVLQERITTARDATGARYIRDVDVVELVAMAPAFRDVGDLYDAYCRRSAPVALPDFLTALATALARRWLVWV